MSLSAEQKERLRSKYGSWAIVTGSSSGIGLELAKQLADAGFNLIINSRDDEKLEAVEQSLRKKNIDVRRVCADLSKSEEVEKIIQAANGLDIGLLINNAGFGTSGLFVDSSLHAEISMLRTNCEAVLLLTHYFAQRFKLQRSGGIIFLSSLVAFQGVPYAANYAATKAYIQSFAEALAMEMKTFNVDVLVATPGPVDSGFGLRANMKLGMAIPADKLAGPILFSLGKKRNIVPGFFSKLLVYSLSILPRFAKIKIMQKVMGGFTAHQRTGKKQ